MIQCYHSCINLPMNWHLSRLCLAVLFCFFCVLLLFGGFAFGFCFRFVVTPIVLGYAQVLYQFTLEAPQLADGHVCGN